MSANITLILIIAPVWILVALFWVALGHLATIYSRLCKVHAQQEQILKLLGEKSVDQLVHRA